MHDKRVHPPVIILGMHRSGTSMVVSLLKELGFFAGKHLDGNFESIFFQRRNQWLMQRAGGSWDYPLPMKILYQSKKLKDMATEVFARSISSRQFASFTGSLKDLVFNTRTGLDQPWGWKDPRTIFTFDIWRSIFPDAKIILLTRNGVDVANSLFTRERNFIKDGHRSLILRPLPHKMKGAFHPFESHPVSSTRCASLTESFKLWEEYTMEGIDAYNNYEGPKKLVRYEDILSEPAGYLREMAEFCGLDCSRNDIRNIAGKVQSRRAYAFAENEQLCNFYEGIRHNKIMKHLGYDEIILSDARRDI